MDTQEFHDTVLRNISAAAAIRESMTEDESVCGSHAACMRSDEYREKAFVAIVEYFSNGFNNSISKVCTEAVSAGIQKLHDEIIRPEITMIANSSGIVPEIKIGSFHIQGFKVNDIVRVFMVILNMLAGVGLLFVLIHLADIRNALATLQESKGKINELILR